MKVQHTNVQESIHRLDHFVLLYDSDVSLDA